MKNNENGRINIISDTTIGKNNKSVISIELDVYKNVEGVKDTNYKGNYNLIITLFSAKDNYAENLKNKQEMSVIYEKKEDTHSSDLTSENVMLGNTENVSSNTIIADDTKSVNTSDENTTPTLTDKCELHKTSHTKTGEALWVISLKDKITSDEYKDLSAKVKKVGGYYSRFAKTPDGKAIPGFIFKTEPDANVIKTFNDFFGYTEEAVAAEAKTDEHIGESKKPETLAEKENTSNNGLNNHPESAITEENTDMDGVKTPTAEDPKQTNEKTNTAISADVKPANAEVAAPIDKQINSSKKAVNDVADFVKDKLLSGSKIISTDLFNIAKAAYGGSMADGVFTPKDAYDAMELGVNKYILSLPEVSTQKMLDILELLPTQTKRTEEMIKYQQFSTPPSIAYLANYAANISIKR